MLKTFWNRDAPKEDGSEGKTWEKQAYAQRKEITEKKTPAGYGRLYDTLQGNNQQEKVNVGLSPKW